jgi:O-antigen/teichoic acid export membrane protein
LVGVLLLAAPLLAQFYQDDRLRWVIPALTLGMASVFVSLQHQSLLARQMRFGALTAIEVGALALGAAAALGAAVRGWGYWALVLQLVVFQLVQGLGYWAVCGWRPAAPRLGIPAEVRTMLAYGANLSGFHLVNRVGMEMDRVLVGYVNGASALGLYAVAYNWAYFPFNQVYFPLLNVAIASLSRAAADDRQYRSQSRQLLMLMFGLCLPALAFLGVAGQSFVLVLLGDQWLEALPIFRVLVLSVFIGSFYRVTKWIYISTGQTQRQFRWGFVHTPVVVAAAALGTIWGPLGVAWGVTLASLGLTYPALAFCLRPTPLTLADFAEAVWRPALASILAAGLLALRQGMAPVDLGAGLNLLVNASLFAGAYGVLLVLLPGGWQDLKQAYGDLRALAGPGRDS